MGSSKALKFYAENLNGKPKRADIFPSKNIFEHWTDSQTVLVAFRKGRVHGLKVVTCGLVRAVHGWAGAGMQVGRNSEAGGSGMGH